MCLINMETKRKTEAHDSLAIIPKNLLNGYFSHAISFVRSIGFLMMSGQIGKTRGGLT